MEYIVIEVEDEKTGITTFHIKNSSNETVSILEEELELNSISEAYQIEEDFIQAQYSEYDSSEFDALFSPSGRLIKKGICEIMYISETNEFIISTNASGDETCYQYTSDHELGLYGVINSSGDYIMDPEWSYIKYNNVFGCYICESNSNNSDIYYRDGEVIGDLLVDLDVALIFKNCGRFLLLSADKSLSDDYEWLSDQIIDTPSDRNAIVAKKNGKYGIIDLNNNNIIVDFIYDEILKESFTNSLKDECPNYDELFFITKLNDEFSIQLMVNDDSLSEYFKCSRSNYKLMFFNAFEFPILIESNDSEFSVYKLSDKLEFISSGNLETEGKYSFAIFAINGKYGFLDVNNSKNPFLPFKYDSIEIFYLREFNNIGKLGFLTSIIEDNSFEIFNFDKNSHSYISIIQYNDKEKTIESFKKMILDSIVLFQKNSS